MITSFLHCIMVLYDYVCCECQDYVSYDLFCSLRRWTCTGWIIELEKREILNLQSMVRRGRSSGEEKGKGGIKREDKKEIYSIIIAHDAGGGETRQDKTSQKAQRYANATMQETMTTKYDRGPNHKNNKRAKCKRSKRQTQKMPPFNRLLSKRQFDEQEIDSGISQPMLYKEKRRMPFVVALRRPDFPCMYCHYQFPFLSCFLSFRP